MRVIILDRKKVGTVIVIVGLMLALLGLEQHFEHKLKMASLVQNNISPLKEYIGLNNKLSYRIPNDWKTQLRDYKSSEIIYHNDFEDSKLKVSGFVQVWNKKGDLKKFLDNSKVVSEKQNKVSNYEIDSIKINEYDGYLIRYIMTTNSNSYVAYEYFIDTEDRFVRFSFFTDKANYKDSLSRMYETIVESLRYN